LENRPTQAQPILNKSHGFGLTQRRQDRKERHKNLVYLLTCLPVCPALCLPHDLRNLPQMAVVVGQAQDEAHDGVVARAAAGAEAFLRRC